MWADEIPEEVIEYIKQEAQKMCDLANSGYTDLWIVGSYAMGTANEDSDIDVAIVTDRQDLHNTFRIVEPEILIHFLPTTEERQSLYKLVFPYYSLYSGWQNKPTKPLRLRACPVPMKGGELRVMPVQEPKDEEVSEGN